MSGKSNIHRLIFGLIILTMFGCSGKEKSASTDPRPDETAIAFYYPWYGNPENDGTYRHWNHRILDAGNESRSFPGGNDIGANFYPQPGCYSSNDTEILNTHMRQLRQAGIGQLAVSWWGIDSFEDKAVPALLDAAANFDIRISFHIEPFENRNALTVVEAIKYIIDRYGEHPAFYRDQRYAGRPLFFVYDSYLINASEWASILAPDGANTIRGTEYDAVMIALWVDPHEEEFITGGGFDGFYTYFATDGFTYGSTIANWPTLARWAAQNEKIFIPCVGPGYIDTRIRPWNTANTRDRENGAYYDRMFAAAIGVDPPFIGITSFNEWHEGTQIEPAVPHMTGSYMYSDYMPLPPNFYLTRTRHWISRRREMVGGSPGDSSSAGISQGSILPHLALHKDVRLTNRYNPKYDAGGSSGLVDGLTGSPSYRDGRWQGFEQVDFGAVVDLGEVCPVSEIKVNFLQCEEAWIFQPISVQLAVSRNGTDYESLPIIEDHPPRERQGTYIKPFIFTLNNEEVRYLEIKARNIGVCPAWHPAAGGKAWLFIDEIIVR